MEYAERSLSTENYLYIFSRFDTIRRVTGDISKTDAAGITKLDIEMFHHESWKYIHLGVKRSKINLTRHKKHYLRGSVMALGCFLLVFNLTTAGSFTSQNSALALYRTALDPHTQWTNSLSSAMDYSQSFATFSRSKSFT